MASAVAPASSTGTISPAGISPVADQLARPGRGVGDDGGKSAGHGLQQRVRRSLEARGHDEKHGAPQIRERIGDMTDPIDAVGDAKLARLLLQLLAKRSIADKREPPIGQDWCDLRPGRE